MKKSPLVSILIANWNGGDIFKACLKSLSKIVYPNWELIIVDNGSTDGSEEFPQDFNPLTPLRVKLIRNKENLGFAKANNQGFNKSKGKYVLLLNNDTKVNQNLLNILVDKMEDDPKIGVIQPKIYLMDKAGFLDNAGSFFTKIGFLKHRGFMRKDGKEFNKDLEVFSVKGACMMIRADVVKKIGLFDKSFFSYFEESDFCWRIWLAGFKVLYYPKTHIFHKVGFTIRRLDVNNINYHYYKNRIRSLIKNLEPDNMILVLSLHLFISLGIVFIFLVKFQPKNSGMIIKALVWNIKNLEDTLRERRKTQKIRILSDREVFKITEKPIDWQQYIKDFKRVENDLKRKTN